MSDIERIQLEAELAAARAKAEVFERALTGRIEAPRSETPPAPAQHRGRRTPVRSVREPTPVEEAEVTDTDRAAARGGLLRAGVVTR